MLKQTYLIIFLSFALLLSSNNSTGQSTFADSLKGELLKQEKNTALRHALLYLHTTENNIAGLNVAANQIPQEKEHPFPSSKFHAYALLCQGDTSGALRYLSEKTEDKLESGNLKDAIVLLGEAAFLHAKTGEQVKLNKLTNQIYSWSDSIDYIHGKVLSSLLRGEIYHFKKLPAKALLAATDAEELFEVANFSDKILVKEILASNLLKDKQPERAIGTYRNLIKFSKEKNLIPLSGKYHMEIGHIHKRYESPKNAETFYLNAYADFKKAGMKKSVADALFTLSKNWEKPDPPKALQYAERSITAYSKLNLLIPTGKALMLQGDLLMSQTVYDQAIESYNRAIQKFERAGEMEFLTNALLKAAELHRAAGNSDSAEKLYKRALSKIEGLNNDGLHIAVLESYIDFKKSYEKPEELTRFTDRLRQLKGEAQQKDMRSRIEELEGVLSQTVEQSDKDRSNFKRESESLRERNMALEESVLTNQIIYFVSLIFFSILIVYGAYKRILLKREKLTLNTKIKELEEENKKLIKSHDAFVYKLSSDLSEGTAKTLSGVKHTFSGFFDELSFETSMKQVRYKQALEYLEEAEDEVFQLSESTLTAKLKNFGLVAAIPAIQERILGDTSIKYTFDYYGISSKERLNQNTEINVFFIFNELLQNSLNHSGAKKIGVNFFKKNNEFKLVIEDDGKTFKPNPEQGSFKGTGLAVIRSRCRIMGASLTFEPGAPKGTITTLRFTAK